MIEISKTPSDDVIILKWYKGKYHNPITGEQATFYVQISDSRESMNVTKISWGMSNIEKTKIKSIEDEIRQDCYNKLQIDYFN